ncbi:FAD-dependent tricarballylate dehydrogenase TcuA [Peribacillus kribbensis]|uniref:FAD-dependent tricarballylate dehydrogenase TcuA n=1 Tax=Peribacillus kribbensis TaxID=356658 RepID=UPI000401FEFF|nr:FAD-dependent tricarballylate dehydrogenase TcuA [Peribacillus kribbensis]
MNQTYETDVVVVGAGNAALCAAISAKELGSRVLVLEKAEKEKRGGNSFFTDGAIRFAYKGLTAIREIVELDEEAAGKISMPEYTEEDYYSDLMRVTEGKSDPELARQLVSQSFETISWMRNHGVKFELNAENQSYEKDGKRHFWGGLPVRTYHKGIGLVQKLNQRLGELGVDVWYGARAVRLTKEDERITGVIVQHGENEIDIKASAVILACGGFEANKAMRSRFMGAEWEAAIVRGTEHNTGDGLQMALEAGAEKYGDWSGCHSIGTDYHAPKVGDFNKPGDIFKKSSFPLGLIINKNGERFVDEGADFRNYTYAKYGREVLKQPDHMAFQVFDAQVRSMLRSEYNLEEATCYQADTLEELADLIPVAKEQFLQTLEAYNSAVQDGEYNPTVKDGKRTEGITPAKSNWALRMDQGPFYAYPVTCGITFSFGGLHVSPEGEVLTKERQPLPGLFAAGEMIGGIFYENYPGGSGLMSGAVYGKLAGASAAGYVKQGNLIKS